MSAGAVSVKNDLIGADIQLFGMFNQEIVCSFTVINRRRILRSLAKGTIRQCCNRHAELIRPVLNIGSKPETCGKSASRNNQDTGAVSLITPFLFGLATNIFTGGASGSSIQPGASYSVTRDQS